MGNADILPTCKISPEINLFLDYFVLIQNLFLNLKRTESLSELVRAYLITRKFMTNELFK